MNVRACSAHRTQASDEGRILCTEAGRVSCQRQRSPHRLLVAFISHFLFLNFLADRNASLN